MNKLITDRREFFNYTRNKIIDWNGSLFLVHSVDDNDFLGGYVLISPNLNVQHSGLNWSIATGIHTGEYINLNEMYRLYNNSVWQIAKKSDQKLFYNKFLDYLNMTTELISKGLTEGLLKINKQGILQIDGDL